MQQDAVDGGTADWRPPGDFGFLVSAQGTDCWLCRNSGVQPRQRRCFELACRRSSL